MQGNYVKLLHVQARDLGKRDGRSSILASRARKPHTDSHSMSSLKERGRVKRRVLQVFCPCFPTVAGMPDWPAGLSAWGRGVPCFPAAADPGERPGGSKTGRSPAGEAGAAGVLDAAGRDPIIGRRGTGGCAVVVAAGPMGSSGAGAPGCGHPSGWPAARRPRGMGLVRAGSGINQEHGPPRGAGARHGGDHALPAAGPAHPASCSAAGVSVP